MEQRLIDANAIPYRDYLGDDEPRVYKSQVDNLPTIDPVKHGRWVRKVDIDELINTCSECHYPVSLWHKTNFCPSCGARMDGENEP